MLNFPGGNKSTQGDSAELPPLLRICVATLFLSQESNPYMELESLIWEKEQKCIWQVIILEQSRLQSFRTVLKQQKMTTGTNTTHHLQQQF